jgi:hypothetical protein
MSDGDEAGGRRSMQRRMQAVAVALVGLVSAGALACTQSNGGVQLNLGPLGFALGFNAQLGPCPVPLAPPPMVVANPVYQAPVYAPPPMVVAPQVMYPPQVVYSPPPVVMAPPPVVYSQPPVVMAPPPVVVAPVVVAAPAPVPVPMAPPVVVAPARPPVVEGPARFAIKYAPGANAAVSLADGVALGRLGATHSFGIEVRLSKHFAFRSDVELRPAGHSWDLVGLKVWLAPDWALRPYLSASLSGSLADNQPGRFLVGVVGAGGLDLAIGRHFFLEAEVRYRAAPGDCCGEVHQLTALIGAGVAFL